jgi:hypothetical protein
MANTYKFVVEAFRPERFELYRGFVQADTINMANKQINEIAAEIFTEHFDKYDKEITEVRWEHVGMGQGHYIMFVSSAWHILGYEKCGRCEGTGHMELYDGHHYYSGDCLTCEGEGKVYKDFDLFVE